MSMSNMGGTNFWARKMQSYGYNKETEGFFEGIFEIVRCLYCRSGKIMFIVS